MRISLIQMNMALASPDENFAKAEALLRQAAKAGCDTAVLPETWNTGFFPHENLPDLADRDGERTTKTMSALAKELRINIVAGSVANVKNGRVYNTAYVFDREGNTVAEYDKTHLFSPMGEHNYFAKGEKTVSFTLDGLKCSVLICYDIRFPELTRTVTLNADKLDVLFLVSEWPDVRIPQLHAIAKARAIENQMFVAVCNSAGRAGETVYGGSSVLFSPLGDTLVSAGTTEDTVSADCDPAVLTPIRQNINVFADRRPELYDYKN